MTAVISFWLHTRSQRQHPCDARPLGPVGRTDGQADESRVRLYLSFSPGSTLRSRRLGATKEHKAHARHVWGADAHCCHVLDRIGLQRRPAVLRSQSDDARRPFNRSASVRRQINNRYILSLSAFNGSFPVGEKRKGGQSKNGNPRQHLPDCHGGSWQGQ